jgi:hypothetical protein
MKRCKVINGYAEIGDIIAVDGYINYKGEYVEHVIGAHLRFKVVGFGEYEGKPQILYKGVAHGTTEIWEKAKSMSPNFELFETANRTVRIVQKAPKKDSILIILLIALFKMLKALFKLLKAYVIKGN